ncbi:MAG TPA: putative Ig domain-containing protein [Candidatus Acidoferrum sp.]|nr:putative Ig domain-containing protein [Candidatus Acidoferrum sp.]
MRSTIPTLGAITCGRRLMFAVAAFGLLLAFVFAQPGFAQSASASDPPLNFGNNFFVTGDYVVAGAYGMNSHLVGGMATGTISIPDANPGIRGATTVPRGAQIVSALLYWQTVEKVAQPGTGQNGFFGPIFNNVPQLYPISGVNVSNHGTVSFSSGGCSGGSTGKTVQTYRADVRGFLPLDASGNVLVDSLVDPANPVGVTFEVRLPSVGQNTPLTLGATLVLVYRVVSPNFPLNVITIYDGAFAPSSTTTLTMSQTVQGFYQAGLPRQPGKSPVSRLTHIVGSGQSNKFQTAYLSGGQNGIQRAAVALPSPYGNGAPAFPGWYGTWDNTTWTFPDPAFKNLPPNPLHENDDAATTMVVPSGSQMGCVSWGAVIVATTIHDDDGDGIPPVWKNNKGYTDVATGQFVSLDDPTDEPKTGQQDIFIQMDHVVDSVNGINHDFTPDPAAVSMVKSAFVAKPHNIHLHITDASKTTRIDDANIISEPGCTDQPLNSPPLYCPYPNQPGVTTWRGGFEFVKNQPLNYPDESSCEQALNEPCIRRFPIAQRNSHHYVVFGDTLGAPNWTFLGGILTDSAGITPGVVYQANSTVTFYTSKGHGLMKDDGTHTQANARVTVTGAITNPNLNGTHFVTNVSCPNSDCSVTNTAVGLYSFTIDIGTSAGAQPSYTLMTDPHLAVASGQASSGSGISDVGGMGTLVTLGKWGADATLSAKAGTLMHELGHTLGLALHGGSSYDKLVKGQAIPDYRPTIEANCKSNYQSVMNYMFQTRLLTNGVLDFSSQQLGTLHENFLLPAYITTTDGSTIAFPTTDWYDAQQTFVINQNGFTVPLGTAATHHCDDTPISTNDVTPTMYFYSGGTQTAGFGTITPLPNWTSTSLDINFDGKIDTSPSGYHGYNDWANVDLRQVGATGSSLVGPGGLFDGPGGFFDGPGGFFDGPGGLFDGPGGFFDGPGGLFDGPGGFFDGPGGFFDGPGGLFAGTGEIDLRNALSVTPPPAGLSASEAASARTITLTWTEPNFPATDHNNIYRSSAGGNFTFIASVPGTAPGTQNTFQDTVTCNPSGYSYFVTTVALNTTTNPPSFQESTQSNTASVGQNNQPLTGCYTFTGFSSPAAGSSAVLESMVPITWSLQDFSNNSGAFVNRTAANTLVAIGPINNDAVCGQPTGSTPRTPIAPSGAGISVSAGLNYVFSFNWNTTGFGPGCYLLELDLDSGQAFVSQTSAFYLSDVSLQVTTTSLSDAIKGVAYNATLSETGGVVGGPAPFSWTVVAGALPPGMSLGVAHNGILGALSGTPTAVGTYNFTVKVTDSIGDFGSQALTLVVDDVVTNTQDAAVTGSLRQAILDVNAAVPGPQPLRILFNISGGGVQTISPVTPLPALAQPTILDGTTQPGYVGMPLIELNGSNAVAPGIHITAGSSTVRGLDIHSFNGDGILIDTSGSNTIQGNYIGTDPTGATALANTGNGIQVIAVPNNAVGGAAPSMRNIISGNSGEGVRIDGTLATGNVVQGNYIGIDVTGSIAVGNVLSGVYIRNAPSNSVIGNVVSGNIGFAGITICGSGISCGGGNPAGVDETSNASGNIVQGNLVGTNSSGTAALGNNQAGLSIDGAPNTVVGGTTAALHNIISFNGTNDIQIFDPGAGGNQIHGNTIQGSTTAATTGISVGASLIGNTLTQNSVSGHAGLGIDVSPSGVNPNQPGGANNYPIISSAQASSGTISGTLNGPANATFTIEFFSNSTCNASGNGEGAVFLGSTSVITDGSGNAVFAVSISGLVAGNSITATSTDASGTTSEFSACVTAN